MYRLIQRVLATLAFTAHACQAVQMALLARAVRDIQVYINDVGMDMNEEREKREGKYVHRPIRKP